MVCAPRMTVTLSFGFQLRYLTLKSWPAPMVGAVVGLLNPVMVMVGGRAELFSVKTSVCGTFTSVPLYCPTSVVLILLPEKVKVASLTTVGPEVLVRLMAGQAPGTLVSVVA